MDWYILQVYSGFEKQVLESIQDITEKKKLSDKISEIYVPTQDVTQMRYGKKNTIKKKLITGYIFVCMDLNEELLHLIKSIPRVSGFVGASNKDGFPFPTSKEEIDNIVNYTDNKNQKEANIEITFQIGESINIESGAFSGFNAVVEEVEEDKQKLKVAVSIFGRLTPVELDYNQVKKLEE